MHFQWHSDCIEISSPGGFPEGVRLDNLLVTAPRPRNPLLADAFKRAGVVERTARGIDTIFFEQLRNGRPAPSYARSDAPASSWSSQGGEANLDFVRLLVTEAQNERDLSLDELLVLNALWQERTLATSDAAQLIQKPDGDARAVLHRLLEPASSKSVVRRRDAPGTFRLRRIEPWVTRLRTCASGGSNPCSRSRWFCSTSKGTDGSLGPRWQTCAAWRLTKLTGCSAG